jgi:hypothetical protein
MFVICIMHTVSSLRDEWARSRLRPVVGECQAICAEDARMYRRRKGTRDARAAYIGVYRIDHFIAVVQVSGPPARTLSLRKDAHAMGVSRFQLVHLPREHPNNSHILVLDEMTEANLLWLGVELARLAPHQRVSTGRNSKQVTS